MAQKTVLALIALPTGPVRVFLAKDAAAVEAASALSGELIASPAFTCSLNVVTALGCTLNTPSAFIAELRVTNVST